LIALGLASAAVSQTKPGAPTTAGKLLSDYNTIVVEKVTLDKNPKLDKFPAGHDTDFQKKIVADLQKKSVFPNVIDGTRQAGEQAADDQQASEQKPNEQKTGEQKLNEQKTGVNASAKTKRLLLSTTIIDYDPGNKALRHSIGWGLGAAKVKARFTLRDEATGQELLIHAQQGKFLGYITKIGTGKNYPVTEATGDIVDGLIRTINKYR
jgi:hypothetical protein